MEVKTCKQCGEVKPTEQFRKYYGGRKGTYRTCKFCEKINAREKYLVKKDAESLDGLSNTEQLELNKIHKLWDIQRAAGLMPPRTTTKESTVLVDSIDSLLDRYDKNTAFKTEVHEHDTTGVPHDLAMWLTTALTEDPDYYLEDVYDQLVSTYRPVLRIENGTTPVYDDTYKDTLAAILDRFYAYEDNYYKEDK